jgi:hypothetical protein
MGEESEMKKFPMPVVYDVWYNDRYRFKFSMIGGQGYLSVFWKGNGHMLSHTISPNLKVARAEADWYYDRSR